MLENDSNNFHIGVGFYKRYFLQFNCLIPGLVWTICSNKYLYSTICESRKITVCYTFYWHGVRNEKVREELFDDCFMIRISWQNCNTLIERIFFPAFGCSFWKYRSVQVSRQECDRSVSRIRRSAHRGRRDRHAHGNRVDDRCSPNCRGNRELYGGTPISSPLGRSSSLASTKVPLWFSALFLKPHIFFKIPVDPFDS